MLQNFLWFIPLNFGAYFIGFVSTLLSGVLMLTDLQCLQTTAVSQGNLLFRIAYFLASLLMLHGVFRVRNENVVISEF